MCDAMLGQLAPEIPDIDITNEAYSLQLTLERNFPIMSDLSYVI